MPLFLRLALAAALSCGAASAASEPLRTSATQAAGSARQLELDVSGEGPLANNAFQPVSLAAAQLIAKGDAALAAATDGASGATERNACFDAWHDALAASRAGEAIPLLDEAGHARELWPDPDASFSRRTEGVSYGVKRRLAALDEATRAAWRSRFELLAAAELERAGTAQAQLARVEWEYPATLAAGRAALRLADLALERGELASCRTWLARAACLAPGQLVAALAARRSGLERIDPRQAVREPWQSARVLELASAHVIGGTLSRNRQRGQEGVGRGVESGLCFLQDGSLVIQGPFALVRWLPPEVRPEGSPGIARFSQGDLVEGRVNRPYASPSAGGWPLLPSSENGRLVCVVGRALGTTIGNALVSLEFEKPGVPLRRWSLSQTGWQRGESELAPLRDALGKGGTWEWQPGPVQRGGRVYALARRLADSSGGETAAGGSEELWLFALDARDGRPLWSRYVTKPADLRLDMGGRMGFGNTLPTSSAPLTWIDSSEGGRLFVGTNLGLGELYDALDGRLVWSFRNRRRDPEAEGWPGSGRALIGARAGVLALSWTPFDSDQLYTLRAGPDMGGGLLLASPQPIEGALALIAHERDSRLVQARWGARQTLLARADSGAAYASIHLGEEESFSGRALVSKERVFVASDRFLYLFDRTRELELIAAFALPVPDDSTLSSCPIGGTLEARGGRIFVVGKDAFWVFDVLE